VDAYRCCGSAGVGANLISSTFESYCTLLVGASGAVFGFMGLFVADLIVNFESIAWPFVRAFVIVLFLVFFVVNAIIENNRSGSVSHASHVGGLICGIFPSMLFLPNLKDKRLAALRRQLQTRSTGTAEASPRRCALFPTCFLLAFVVDRASGSGLLVLPGGAIGLCLLVAALVLVDTWQVAAPHKMINEAMHAGTVALGKVAIMVSSQASGAAHSPSTLFVCSACVL
jgi:hypothetical protein